MIWEVGAKVYSTIKRQYRLYEAVDEVEGVSKVRRMPSRCPYNDIMAQIPE